MSVDLYGITSCSTVTKAKRWLEAENIDYQFHNFKKDGIEADTLARWIADYGLETVLNKRSTTWRKLPEADRSDVDAEQAVRLMQDNPSLIKRPVVETNNSCLFGFKEAAYQELFL